MNADIDIECFVKDPGFLIKVCRETIERICNTPEDPNIGEQEAQLREIAKAIDKLEKIQVPIPDALRAEKTKLAVALGHKACGIPALPFLIDEFENILKDLKKRLNDGVHARKMGTGHKTKRSRSPKTDKQTLRENIVRALRKLGGGGRVPEVIEEMGRQLEGKLLPGDMEWRESTAEYAWQNNAKWERYRMAQDGTLRSNSPRGYWELGEGHR
ncbi:MAG: hypothetical protein JRE23_11490 [Deltaproteobacteria bacterium]|nr:hypothetical protein [Deltaproteobacteria bacterium]